MSLGPDTNLNMLEETKDGGTRLAIHEMTMSSIKADSRTESSGRKWHHTFDTVSGDEENGTRGHGLDDVGVRFDGLALEVQLCEELHGASLRLLSHTIAIVQI